MPLAKVFFLEMSTGRRVSVIATAGSAVCPSLALNGTIPIYAEIAHHCAPTIRRDDAAGQRARAADSRRDDSSIFDFSLSTRGSCQDAVGDRNQEGGCNHEKRNCPDADDAETESQLRSGNED